MLFVEAVGAVETGIGPQLHFHPALGAGVGFSAVHHMLRQPGAALAGIGVDFAEFPHIAPQRAGGDHADDAAGLFGHPEGAVLLREIAGEGVEFRHFAVDIDDAAGIFQPAFGEQGDEAGGVIIPSGAEDGE